MSLNVYEIEIFNQFVDAMKIGFVPPNESSEGKEKRIKYEIEIKDSIGQKRTLKTMHLTEKGSPIYAKGCAIHTYGDIRIFENDLLTETTICYYFTMRRSSDICVPLRVCKGTPFKIHECLRIFREKNHKGLW